MKSFANLIDDVLPEITEIFPWDLDEKLKSNPNITLLDIREPYEFEVMRIKGSINVPRGVLESACDWGFEETVPEIACCRDREVVVICRSGNRSVFAAEVMQQMGYKNVVSLKTGMRGWSDYEQPMVDKDNNEIDEDNAIEFFTARLRPEQMSPQ